MPSAPPTPSEQQLESAIEMRRQGRLEQADLLLQNILSLEPDQPEALAQRGHLLVDLNRLEEALAVLDRALRIRPSDPELLNSRGNALKDIGRPQEALACYDRALAVRPDYPEALSNRGNALRNLGRLGDALESFDRALALRPVYANALNNRGSLLNAMGRPAEALVSYSKALSIKPDHPYALSGLANAAVQSCDWPRTEEIEKTIVHHVQQGGSSVIQPFVLLGYDCEETVQVACVKRYLRHKFPSRPAPLWRGEAYTHPRIRVGYLSADLHDHAMAFLMAEMFELHDRWHFETFAFSHGPPNSSAMRRRLEAAFDHFHDVRERSDSDIAQLIRNLEIDIAVDLSGYTRDARFAILAHRPAPVQVSYLAYPGTLGADFIDYVIADPTVLPFDQQPFYAEQIVHLPDCYQVNDRRRSIASETPTRSEVGLPETGFVFCSFNNSYKITAKVFSIWMRLLAENADSVLWLLADNEGAVSNLRREAELRGIRAERLVFAPRAPLDRHLARQRLADLFLDTLPYNAHTTASDALWAGLPLVTCLGNRFQGRVAASLLRAIGLPELVTRNLDEYEALVRRLVAEPALLKAYRDRLETNRLTTPLFDTPRFTRNIEAAYERMHAVAKRGERPKPFAVQSA